MFTAGPVLEALASSRELLRRGLADRNIYGDPDIYYLEQRRVFARSWLIVAHESQIPNPSDFVESFMGEESVIVCRDLEGRVNVLLNTCRQRGNKVCRAEAGNSNTFLCQYHGWTFDTEGRFIGAPHFETVYENDVDRSEWGLKKATVAIYKGLIFATFNPRPVPLEEFLGDFTWILDMMLEPRPGGVEVNGGFLRWTINMNWKFGAENSGGDTYHGATTHASARGIGHKAASSTRDSNTTAAENAGFTMCTPYGHIVNGGWTPPGLEPKTDTLLRKYYAEHREESIALLGEPRATGVSRFNANVYPNAGFHTSAMTIHLLHPRGPNCTEVWLLPLVDKNAPDDVKAWARREADHHFGPAGFFEEDDGENWEQATAACFGAVGSTLPFNLQMGIGREEFLSRTDTPKLLAGQANEYGQRAFLDAWFEQMLTE